MIEPRPSRFFTAFFARHARARLSRSFEAVYARGLDEARDAAARGPVLFVANHTSWWDALVALHVSRTIDVEVYALMDAKNLRALPFFRWIGAFGVDLDEPRDGARAIRFAARLLDRPRRALWIFPQGQERPVTERPLRFRPGSERIAALAPGAAVLPVGLRYEHGAHERPELFVSIGAPHAAGAGQREAVESELERIDAALLSGDRGAFTRLVEGHRGWVDAVAQRALASFARRLQR